MAELQDFIDAQDKVWPEVEAELRSGRKTSHWIWYVFPQLDSLGRSPMAQHYGLSGLDEARNYLAHPLLRARLEQAAQLLLDSEVGDPVAILGETDAMKVRSSMTLFEAVEDAPPVFSQVLDRLYSSERCPHTRKAIG
ncbi:DUF1810 domain-containing protein [Wenxinia marina]|uniref:Calpastatin n=1 Tax=Wenxinia marina DSM 24838 TaxID=1123501 RepID=A0A0D0NS30_9RHOB|nr:DUF1810 domain-containing protein [Wenxinia marina]KIQ71040.1 hypothetical protein Wenmar_00418 [Wenxinia marina DSM 24838]GGL55350.1 calpastatin [Wenxinia marina]